MISRTNTRGFTLIELLVVIAIIGILASVVLASLNSARDKGATAAIKSSINNARAQAELFYDDAPRSYTGLCADPVIVNIATAVEDAGGSAIADVCDVNGAGTEYRITSILVGAPAGSEYYCVDSSGAADVHATAAYATGATQCP